MYIWEWEAMVDLSGSGLNKAFVAYDLGLGEGVVQEIDHVCQRKMVSSIARSMPGILFVHFNSSSLLPLPAYDIKVTR